MGDDLKAWRSRRRSNAANILQVADQVAFGDMEPDPSDLDGHRANLRVASQALGEGSWTDDETARAYLGGLLAGSRSRDGNDDANLPWVKLINSLSTDAILLHYIVYRCIAEDFPADKLDLAEEYHAEHNFRSHRVEIPTATWQQLVDDQNSDRLEASISELRRTSLLHDTFGVTEQGDDLWVTPTNAGARLFTRSHGSKSSVIAGFDITANPVLADLLEERRDGLTVDPVRFKLRAGAEPFRK